MKSKIKKRIDENKNNNKTSMVLLWTIFLILVVASGALYLTKDSLIEYFSKEKEVVSNNSNNTDNNKVTDDGFTKVSIDSPNIKNLFNLVHRAFTSGDGTIFNNKKLNVSEMDDLYKFSLASNLYTGEAVRNNTAKENEITAYIDEEIVKEKYEVIFGTGTYKRLDEIPYSCTSMYYDAAHRRYVTTNQICGSIEPFSTHEIIIDAKKKDKELFITSAVVFAESYTGTVCKDYQCKNIIDSYSTLISEDEYFKNYIEKNKDKLMQYTYKFKLNDDGFYYYQGFKRTKE